LFVSGDPRIADAQAGCFFRMRYHSTMTCVGEN
jgi:hypothetical protein